MSTSIPSAVPPPPPTENSIPVLVTLFPALWRELTRPQVEQEEQFQEDEREYRERVLLLGTDIVVILGDIRGLLQIIVSHNIPIHSPSAPPHPSPNS